MRSAAARLAHAHGVAVDGWALAVRAAAGRRQALEPPLLLAGLAAAVAVRVGVAGPARGTSPAGGAAFGAALLLLATAAGWRPARLSGRVAAAGVAGGLALLAVPFVAHIGAGPLRFGPPAAAFPLWLAVVTLVAVAEEALLRGALMTALLRHTRAEAAVLVAALAFAALHVPIYGWVAVPLDVAVGVWLGGLRLATGGAGAPAIAHTVADVATWWLR
jgi:membrane protease YdiL (CAAX protease family)